MKLKSIATHFWSSFLNIMSYDVTMTSYIKSYFFHEFLFLSIWWRWNASNACNLSSLGYLLTISDLVPLGSRLRSQQISRKKNSKWFFNKLLPWSCTWINNSCAWINNSCTWINNSCAWINYLCAWIINSCTKCISSPSGTEKWRFMKKVTIYIWRHCDVI